MARILIVEDETELRGLLVRGLREEGYEAIGAGTGRQALEKAGSGPARPDALIVDIGLPDTDGRDLCQALRANGVEAPVLFLTARDALTDRLAAFSAGGDDYVTKPFAFDEVVARLRALLKRAQVDGAVMTSGMRLDPVSHGVSCGDESVRLTPTEFRLLAALAGRPGETVRRRELVRAAWPDGAIVHDNTLDVYIARLRRKLGSLDGAPVIETAHGVGYAM